MFGFELREQAIDVVDVPRPFDLRDHDHVELVSDLADDSDQVVEHPRTVERVDPHPELGLTELDLARDADQPFTSVDLAISLDRVLEVAEQHVDLGNEVGNFARHLRIAGIEEVNHPARPERDFTRRFGSANGQGFEEIAVVAHGANFSRSWSRRKRFRGKLVSTTEPTRKGWWQEVRSCRQQPAKRRTQAPIPAC